MNQVNLHIGEELRTIYVSCSASCLQSWAIPLWHHACLRRPEQAWRVWHLGWKATTATIDDWVMISGFTSRDVTSFCCLYVVAFFFLGTQSSETSFGLETMSVEFSTSAENDSLIFEFKPGAFGYRMKIGAIGATGEALESRPIMFWGRGFSYHLLSFYIIWKVVFKLYL